MTVISPAVPFWQVLGSHLQGQPILLAKLHSPQAREANTLAAHNGCLPLCLPAKPSLIPLSIAQHPTPGIKTVLMVFEKRFTLYTVLSHTCSFNPTDTCRTEKPMDLGVNPYAAKDWLKARTALHLGLQ